MRMIFMILFGLLHFIQDIVIQDILGLGKE